MGEEYLLIGALLVLAVGVALLLGTVAAMVQVKRTGRLPGSQERHQTLVATPGVIARLVIGAVVTVLGVAGVWSWFA